MTRRWTWLALAGLATACGAAEESGRDARGAQSVASREYAAAQWLPAHASNYTAGRQGQRVEYLIVHTVEGSTAAAVSWFQTAGSAASAHYIVGRDGAVVQSVSERDTAWQAGSWAVNTRSVGIEHEGYMDGRQPFTDAQYRASARLLAMLSKRYGVPLDRDHVVGHYQVYQVETVSFCPSTTAYDVCVGRTRNHADPGATWDWERYMRYAREERALLDGTPSPSTTTACGARAGYYVWTCDDPRTRMRCRDGALEQERCALECLGRPTGVDDVCATPSDLGPCGDRATFTHWNCVDARTLQKCVSGRLLGYTCQGRCAARPIGEDDTCEAASTAPSTTPTPTPTPTPMPDASVPLTVNGYRLSDTEARWVRYTASAVVPYLSGGREQRLTTASRAAWWALKEGVWGLSDATAFSSCNRAPGRDERLDAVTACYPSTAAWQVGLAAVQVPNFGSDEVERVALALFPGQSVVQVLAAAAREAGIDPASSTGQAIVASTGTLRRSWLLRASRVGFSLVVRNIEAECINGAQPWCYSAAWSPSSRYAPDRTAALRAMADLRAILASLAP